jgi:hypothetical protein
VEQAKALGFAPPGLETFSEVGKRFLAHQKARLTGKAYEREKGIINKHLIGFFTGPSPAPDVWIFSGMSRNALVTYPPTLFRRN